MIQLINKLIKIYECTILKYKWIKKFLKFNKILFEHSGFCVIGE